MDLGWREHAVYNQADQGLDRCKRNSSKCVFGEVCSSAIESIRRKFVDSRSYFDNGSDVEDHEDDESDDRHRYDFTVLIMWKHLSPIPPE
jgi:hypothetical protein